VFLYFSIFMVMIDAKIFRFSLPLLLASVLLMLACSGAPEPQTQPVAEQAKAAETSNQPATAEMSDRPALAGNYYELAADCFDFLVDNVAIGFSRFDCFPAISAWNRHERPMKAILWQHAAEIDDRYSPGLREAIAKMREEGRASIGKDFDHSAPDWADILALGFPGMLTPNVRPARFDPSDGCDGCR
jgi:hypothetical protein